MFALALTRPSGCAISGFLATKIRKAIPNGMNSEPSAVHRGILERSALRSSIQIMSGRLFMLRPFLQPNQPEEVLLQFFFFHHQLRGRRPGFDQEAVDSIRMCNRRSISKRQGP